MRATEFIRDILDLIDKIDCIDTDVEMQNNDERAAAQVADLVTDLHSNYTTAPNERYADITAVTTGAGGGVNGPKHPDDLRGNSFRIYGDN
jgi:hypothetical protein